jgi:molecular chaperone DnaJ
MGTDYEILGISAGASKEEIKKAYRRIAHKFHPDKNKNPDAVDVFKSATKAYDNLLNITHKNIPKEQSKYKRKGLDISVSISATLYDIAHCVKKSITTVRVGKCTHCNGTGSAQGKIKVCSYCGGNGFQGMALIMGQKKSCVLCTGAGTIPEGDKCSACDGAGLAKETIIRDIMLSPFSERIQIYGSGNYCTRGEAGNLIVEVHPEKHPVYSFQGLDINGSVNISPAQAIIGDKIYLDVIGSREEVLIPPGTTNGQILWKSDAGIKFGDKKGRLKIKVRITIPPVITSEEKSYYEQILKIEKETDPCLRTWKL